MQDISSLRAETLHKETREELLHADNKATTLLSVVGLILGGLLAGASAGAFSPRDLDNVAEWVFWIGVTLAIVAEVGLCLAILPNVSHAEHKGALRYFGHVAQFEDERTLSDALSGAHDNHERLVSQLLYLSKVVDRKYRLIRRSLLTLGASALLCIASLLLDTFLL
jgi:hypothetical protein